MTANLNAKSRINRESRTALRDGTVKTSSKVTKPNLLHAIDTEDKSSKSGRTYQRILLAAARVFRDHGYAGARLVDIAAEAGLKAGSLYYHFDSREALVEEVIVVGGRRVLDLAKKRLGSLPPDARPLEKLAVLIESHLVSVLQQGEISSAIIQLIRQAPVEIRERTLFVQREYGALWRAILQEGRTSGAIRSDVNLSAIRMAILGALNWATAWYDPGGASPKRIAQDIVKMVLHGLATDPSSLAKRVPKKRRRSGVTEHF